MQNHINPSTGTTIYALDGIRGIAIISVILHHCLYFPPLVPHAAHLNGFLQCGRLGVSVFFVLSGFLMGLVIFRETGRFNWLNYTRRRFGRIYPPFVFSVCLAALVALTRGHDLWDILVSCFMNLTTIANWSKPPVKINGVYWSLLIEIHFYIVLPCVYFLLRIVTKHAAIWTCTLFTLIPFAIRMWRLHTGDLSMIGWDGFPIVFPQRLDAFSFGMIFSLIYLNPTQCECLRGNSHKFVFWGVGILALSYVCYGLTFAIPSINALNRPAMFLEIFHFTASLGTFAILWVVFIGGAFISNLLSKGSISFCGLVSYEWYLLHYIILYWCRDQLPAGTIPGYLGKLLIPSFGGLLLSWFMYKYFSLPVQLWFRGFKR